MKKLVGIVSIEERDEIQALYERKNGLNELAKIITPENVFLYEKVLKDLGENSTRFQNWWMQTSSKYHWESVENGSWEIDFNTCKIYLVSPQL